MRDTRGTSATEWVTLGEASRLLGIAPATLRRWSDAGRVDARQIVRQGFGPSPEAVAHAVMKGHTREQFTRGWRSELVEGSTTPWLLCQSCALQAKAFMPGGLGR